MADNKCSILSIAPYGFLPPKSGGHQAVAQLHHHLALLCEDNVVSTVNNGNNNFAFNLHKIFPDKPLRYTPRYASKEIIDIARKHKSTHIICEHPYMSFTAIAVSKKLGIPWYSRSHNIESQRFKALGKPWWQALAIYERYSMQKAEGVLFITKEDAEWAIKNYNIAPDKCHIIPFGTNLNTLPKSQNNKDELANTFNISPSKPWLYFLGALDYKPNEDAVRFIIDEIAPRLSTNNIATEILIAGKGLNTDTAQKIKELENIHYIGFVPELDTFLNACDIMLNPVMTGGGIKTKAVEALGNNNTVISSKSGAAGLDQSACGGKLLVTNDFNWDEFADAVQSAINTPMSTPDSFYEMYYQGNIAQKVLSIFNC